MKRFLVLLVSLTAVACATAPGPSPALTPQAETVARDTVKGAIIGRIIGTAAGIAGWLDDGDSPFGSIEAAADAGELIGAMAGAAHGARMNREFDEQEDALAAIDGVDIVRVLGDEIKIRPAEHALPDVARHIVRFECEVELIARDEELATETERILVANGVDRGDIRVRIDPDTYDVMLLLR